MLILLRDKIQQVKFYRPENIKELEKLLRIAKHVIHEESRNVSPPFPYFAEAVKQLGEIEKVVTTDGESYKEQFEQIKEKMLEVVNNLFGFIENEKLYKSKDILKRIKGEIPVKAIDKIEFALLEVEQNNYDYFKDLPSHLPSQPHDRLFSHYIITWDSGLMMALRFHKDDNLPEYIKQEAIDAFKKTGEPKPDEEE